MRGRSQRRLGILVQPAYMIQDELDTGRLVRVLDDWDLPRLTMNIAFSTKSLLPARTRLLIDFLVERFQQNKYEELWTRFAHKHQTSSRAGPSRR